MSESWSHCKIKYLNYKAFLWNKYRFLSGIRDISLSLENNEATANNCIFTLPLAFIPVESQLYHKPERFQSSGFAMDCGFTGISCVKTFVHFSEEQSGPRCTSALKQTGQTVATFSYPSDHTCFKGWNLFVGWRHFWATTKSAALHIKVHWN